MRLKFWKKHKNPAIEARKYFQARFDYWDGRVLLGDIFLDEWMSEAYDGFKKGLEALDKLEAAGYKTGKDEVVSTLVRHPQSIVIRSRLIGNVYSATATVKWIHGTSQAGKNGLLRVDSDFFPSYERPYSTIEEVIQEFVDEYAVEYPEVTVTVEETVTERLYS